MKVFSADYSQGHRKLHIGIRVHLEAALHGTKLNGKFAMYQPNNNAFVIESMMGIRDRSVCENRFFCTQLYRFLKVFGINQILWL